MKPSKEKVLLVAVIGVVAAVAAMDSSYVPVRVPATTAPTDVPPLPGAPAAYARSPRPQGRSMFDIFSDLKAPPLLDLPEVPVLEVPIAAPPVRPYPHLDAARGLRHLFFDPPVTPPETASAPPPEDAEASIPTLPPPRGDEGPPPVDLAAWDWVKLVDGLGQTLYGKIDLLPADREARRTKFQLLVDRSLDFTFHQINPRDGRFIAPPIRFRERTGELGFSDTIENNYASRRIRMEAGSGRSDLDLPQLRELAAWTLEEAGKPRYDRRKAWALAAETYYEVLRRNPDDKDTLKDLGRVLRLLQDLEAEVALYDWWLARQKLSKDPEVLALSGEALEFLGLRDRARGQYEEALRTLPDPRVRVRLGEILLSTGSLEDARAAVEVFRRAAQEGERAAGVTGEGKALLATGDIAGAKAALGRITADAEKDAAWYNAMGAVHYTQAGLAEAQAHFQAALDKSPAPSESRAVARTNLAVVKARQAALLAEGETARKAGLEDALRTAEEALKDDPFNYYWPLVARAYAFRALAEPDRAVEAAQEAVAAWPGEAYGRYLLGEFLLRDGRHDEARTHLREAARLAPGFPDALGGVGRAGGGEAGETRDFLRRAMELEPRSTLWPLLASRAVLADEGLPLKQRLEEARRDLVHLLEKVDRNSAVAQCLLGWVRYYQGDANEALDRWNTALRLLGSSSRGTVREGAYQDSLQAWIKASIQKVSKWQSTRIWRDEFDRPDGQTLGNGWSEDDRGVRVSLQGGAAHIGPGKLGGGEKPSFHREWDASRVLKLVVEAEVAPEEPEQFDILLWMPQGKVAATLLGLRKTESGKAQLLVKPDHRTKDADIPRDVPGLEWPADGRVSFGFVKMDESRGTVALVVNDRVVPGYEALEIQNLMKTRGGRLRVEIVCQGSQGTEVRAKVEAVEAWLDIQ